MSQRAAILAHLAALLLAVALGCALALWPAEAGAQPAPGDEVPIPVTAVQVRNSLTALWPAPAGQEWACIYRMAQGLDALLGCIVGGAGALTVPPYGLDLNLRTYPGDVLRVVSYGQGRKLAVGETVIAEAWTYYLPCVGS